MLAYALYFGQYDWTFSVENQLAQQIETLLEERINEAKKIVIEKNQKRFKFIMYRDEADGGI